MRWRGDGGGEGRRRQGEGEDMGGAKWGKDLSLQMEDLGKLSFLGQFFCAPTILELWVEKGGGLDKTKRNGNCSSYFCGIMTQNVYLKFQQKNIEPTKN